MKQTINCGVALFVAMVLATLVSGQSLQSLVDKKVAVLKELSNKATVMHANRCNDLNSNCKSDGSLGCSVPACGDSFPADKGFTCNTSWGSNDKICGGGSNCEGLVTSVQQGTIRFAPFTEMSNSEVAAFTCSSKNMDATFAANDAQGHLKGWQYVGSMTGVSRFYPGQPQYRTTTCCPYDPRQRPWFITATSGPKDVVLVMDTSGSMKGDRLKAMKSTAKALLGSMTNTDYVSVVEFNSNARSLKTSSLLNANDKNVEDLQNEVDNLEADGGTYMKQGFTTAFNILRSPGSSSSCTRIIIFLTDGKASDEADVIPAINAGQNNMGSNKAHIFTYSMGSGADHTLPKRIACENDGVWASISDGVDPLSEMSQYYQFLAAGIDSSDVRWTAPYEDAFGLGQMVTGAIPVYDRTQSVPLLVAVVGTDVLMSELEAYGDKDAVVSELTGRSKVCPTISMRKCQMQHIRGSNGQCTTSDYSGFSISECNSRNEIVELKTCASNSGGTNAVLCEQIVESTQVSSNPLTTQEVACCSGCNQPGQRNDVCRLTGGSSQIQSLVSIAAVVAVALLSCL